MAIFESEIRDGIQLANGNDYCIKCHRPGATIPAGHSLEYKEIFKMYLNGMNYCLCLEHLQELLGDYALVHKESLKSEDTIEVPREMIEHNTEEEVIEFIRKAAVKHA